MISMSIFWASGCSRSIPNGLAKGDGVIMRAKAHAVTNANWSLWFALFSPIIGILLVVLGVFILGR